MKRFVLLTVGVTLGLFGLSAGSLQAAGVANTNALLITFQISGISQHTTVVTNNNVETTTYTSSPIKVGNQNILDLLQAEFSTTFPSGAQLAYNLTGDSGFHVLDQNGNPILNASTNPLDSAYGFGLSNSVTGANSPQVITGKIDNNLVTSNQSEVVTAVAPDYGIFYYDSHGNDFHIDGLLTLKANVSTTSSSTVYSTVSFTIVGSGGGSIFNPANGKNDTNVFTKVKVSAKGKDVRQ